ncbi:hypothetical protein M153_7809000150, partial [Pseudoloma neurophilia]
MEMDDEFVECISREDVLRTHFLNQNVDDRNSFDTIFNLKMLLLCLGCEYIQTLPLFSSNFSVFTISQYLKDSNFNLNILESNLSITFLSDGYVKQYITDLKYAIWYTTIHPVMTLTGEVQIVTFDPFDHKKIMEIKTVNDIQEKSDLQEKIKTVNDIQEKSDNQEKIKTVNDIQEKSDNQDNNTLQMNSDSQMNSEFIKIATTLYGYRKCNWWYETLFEMEITPYRGDYIDTDTLMDYQMLKPSNVLLPVFESSPCTGSVKLRPSSIISPSKQFLLINCARQNFFKKDSFVKLLMLYENLEYDGLGGGKLSDSKI